MARTLLLYGKTGSTKTSNAGQLVEYLFERFGVPVRGVFGDNRGPVQTQVNSGKLIPWDITTHADPLGCIIAASKGYWPTKLEDGFATGPLRLTTPEEFQGLAGYLVEGLSENGSLIMRDREDKKISTGEPLVAETLEPITGTSDLKIAYAMGSRGTYQFAQVQTHRYVKNGFAKLPVPWSMFTAHQVRTFDKYNNRVLGPVIVGKALVESIPQWFDITLHLEDYIYDLTVKTGPGGKQTKVIKRQGMRAYFTSHQDTVIPSAMWPAKLGVPPELMSSIFDKYPEGFVPLILDGPNYVSSVASLIKLIDEHSDSQISVGENS